MLADTYAEEMEGDEAKEEGDEEEEEEEDEDDFRGDDGEDEDEEEEEELPAVTNSMVPSSSTMLRGESSSSAEASDALPFFDDSFGDSLDTGDAFSAEDTNPCVRARRSQRSMVARSTKPTPVSLSVKKVSMTFWRPRPARRQKRKSGSTESRFDFSQKLPVGKSCSTRTKGVRRRYPSSMTSTTREPWKTSESWSRARAAAAHTHTHTRT